MRFAVLSLLLLLSLASSFAGPVAKTSEKKSLTAETKTGERENLKIDEPGTEKDRSKKSTTTFCVEIRPGASEPTKTVCGCEDKHPPAPKPEKEDLIKPTPKPEPTPAPVEPKPTPAKPCKPVQVQPPTIHVIQHLPVPQPPRPCAIQVIQRPPQVPPCTLHCPPQVPQRIQVVASAGKPSQTVEFVQPIAPASSQMLSNTVEILPPPKGLSPNYPILQPTTHHSHYDVLHALPGAVSPHMNYQVVYQVPEHRPQMFGSFAQLAEGNLCPHAHLPGHPFVTECSCRAKEGSSMFRAGIESPMKMEMWKDGDAGTHQVDGSFRTHHKQANTIVPIVMYPSGESNAGSYFMPNAPCNGGARASEKMDSLMMFGDGRSNTPTSLQANLPLLSGQPGSFPSAMTSYPTITEDTANQRYPTIVNQGNAYRSALEAAAEVAFEPIGGSLKIPREANDEKQINQQENSENVKQEGQKS